ncbi:MAG: hypothetical protein AAFP86_20795, partial [Planctomycetota bacterium]
DRSAGTVTLNIVSDLTTDRVVECAVQIGAGTTLSAPTQFVFNESVSIPSGGTAASVTLTLNEEQISAAGTIELELSVLTDPNASVGTPTLTIDVTAIPQDPAVGFETSSTTVTVGSSAMANILASGVNKNGTELTIALVGGDLTTDDVTWDDAPGIPPLATAISFSASSTQAGTAVFQITAVTEGRVEGIDTLSVDFQAAALPNLRFQQQSVNVNEGGTTTLSIVTDVPVPQNVLVGVSFLPAESSASTDDFTIDGQTPIEFVAGESSWIQLTMLSGTSSLDIDIAAIADATPDNFEAAVLFLVYSPSQVSSNPTDRRCTITIDDGTSPPVDPTIEPVAFSTTQLNLSGSSGSLELTRNQPSSAETVLVTLQPTTSTIIGTAIDMPLQVTLE